jgi:hypothetical protein
MSEVIPDDVLHWVATYDGPAFHALLSDPPYHLTDPRDPRRASPSASQRANRERSAGFMGKQWDGGDIAFRPETWAALTAHLYPGAFGMVFASSRGWHRLACAIEDAGMVIHPTLFCWATGQGFPKSTRVPDSRFDGHRYGLQCLKPSVEPIIVFQKPYAGKPVECITATGAGALNIDGSRIGNERDVPASLSTCKAPNGIYGDYGGGNGKELDRNIGRWPANFILDEAAAARLDAQSGVLTSGKMKAWQKRHKSQGKGGYNDGFPDEATREDTYGDAGGASRFFYVVREQLDAADPVRYVAKASRRERDAGLGELPMSDGVERTGRKADSVGLVGNPDYRGQTANPYSTTAVAPVHNPHPTVKPIALMRYLATLLLPPAEYAPRRIVVPFAGVASECIGAALAGWEDVVGIEREAEYAEIGRERLAHWIREQQCSPS